jgi:hypothetical protein
MKIFTIVICVLCIILVYLCIFSKVYKFKGGGKFNTTYEKEIISITNQDYKCKFGFVTANDVEYVVDEKRKPTVCEIIYNDATLASIQGMNDYKVFINPANINYGFKYYLTDAYMRYLKRLDSSIPGYFSPDGIIVSNYGIIMMEGDEDDTFHSSPTEMHYIFKILNYYVLLNHHLMLKEIDEESVKNIKNNFREGIMRLLNHESVKGNSDIKLEPNDINNIYNGKNATLIRFKYNDRFKESSIQFGRAVREISEMVRYFQKAFYDCIVLVNLEKYHYQMCTIDFKTYTGTDIVLTDLFNSEKNFPIRHFFRHVFAGEEFNFEGFAHKMRNEYLTTIENRLPNPTVIYENNEFLDTLFTPENGVNKTPENVTNKTSENIVDKTPKKIEAIPRKIEIIHGLSPNKTPENTLKIFPESTLKIFPGIPPNKTPGIPSKKIEITPGIFPKSNTKTIVKGPNIFDFVKDNKNKK